MKTILALAFPTDHRRAAVGFLAVTAAVAFAGLVVTLAMRLTAHGFASPAARAEWGDADRHAVLFAHFVAVPLLPLVVGFAALPAATVRKRVVFPWLLAANLPLHAVACGWACAEALRREFQYGDAVARLGPPFALLQLSLLLASVNLFGTALFRRSRADPDERLPLLVWSVGATAALTAATWVASFPSWQAAVLGMDPMEYGSGWERWPHFHRLLSVCGGLLAAGVCLHACLGERGPGRGAKVRETARALGVASVWLLAAGHAFTFLLLFAGGRSGRAELGGEAFGAVLLAVTSVFALIAAVRRGQFREPPPALAAVVGLFLAVAGLATGVVAESRAVERLIEEMIGVRFRGREFEAVPPHARAAAIVFAFLAVRLRGRGLGFGLTAVGVLLLTVGVSVALGAEVGLGLEGKAARWGGRRASADDPLGVAVSVGGLLSVLGLAVALVGSVAERGKLAPKVEPDAAK